MPCWWGGIALLLLAEIASIHQFLAGGHPSIERYLMVLAVAALVLMVAARQVFRRVSWILLFLFLNSRNRAYDHTPANRVPRQGREVRP